MQTFQIAHLDDHKRTQYYKEAEIPARRDIKGCAGPAKPYAQSEHAFHTLVFLVHDFVDRPNSCLKAVHPPCVLAFSETGLYKYHTQIHG